MHCRAFIQTCDASTATRRSTDSGADRTPKRHCGFQICNLACVFSEVGLDPDLSHSEAYFAFKNWQITSGGLQHTY